MALPGETMGPNVETFVCPDCGTEMKRDVQQSAAGFYIGFWCNQCGPWSRESGYYPTCEAASAALVSDNVSWR